MRGRLRDHGVRRRLVTRERAETGWAAMTDSELAVARLVAQGLTNREVAEQLFVSPHTVSSHLRSIFAKLDDQLAPRSRPDRGRARQDGHALARVWTALLDADRRGRYRAIT